MVYYMVFLRRTMDLKKTMDVFCLCFNDFKVFCSLLFLDPLN